MEAISNFEWNESDVDLLGVVHELPVGETQTGANLMASFADSCEVVQASARTAGDADAEERSRPRRAPEAVADPASAEEGRCLSNTYPHTSQWRLPDHPEDHLAGGFDWLAWSAGVEWNPLSFDSIFPEFELLKNVCQSEKMAFAWKDLQGGDCLTVHRTGLNHGGDKGQHYEFKLSFRGITIGMAKHKSAAEKRLNLFVKLQGRDCLLYGAQQAYGTIRELIRLLGGEIKFEKLSRADLCLDIASLDMGVLQAVVESGQFVASAHTVKPHNELVNAKKSGFEVGKSPLHLTVYDKTYEQHGKCDALYLAALVDRRWGGELPATATRVEFQVSRPWLVKQGINSPPDLFRLAGALAAKLSQDWFRLTDAPVDRENNNQSRATTLPLWKSIQQGFAMVFGQPVGSLIPLDRERIHPLRLVRQGRGCIANAMLQRGTQVKNYNDFVFESARLLYSAEESDDDREEFVREYHRRETQFAA